MFKVILVISDGEFRNNLLVSCCSDIETDPQCFKYYNGVFDKTQEIGRKENNPFPSKEDNWIIRGNMRTTERETERTT